MPNIGMSEWKKAQIAKAKGFEQLVAWLSIAWVLAILILIKASL
jgi:hypothetical protein